MQEIQILKSEKDEWYHVYNKKYKINIVNDWQKVSSNIPVICSGNLLYDNVQHWLTNNQLAVYVGRGYLGNHLTKTRRWWRFSINGWANIQLMNIPYSRWEKLNLPKHAWKVKEVKRVLIAPSKMTSKIWTPDLGHQWAESMVDKFPGAEVRIRKKGETPAIRWETLWNDLDWADLVVSQSSAITAEAFWYGKKVISTEPCITWAAKRNTLEDWKDPSEPELRDQWHEHLAWSQYTIDEIQSGNVLDMIQLYLGNLSTCKFNYNYNLYRRK